MGFKPAPASMPPPIIHPPTISLHGLGGGMMSPSGTMMIQPTARPPPPPGARGELIPMNACYRALLTGSLGIGLDA